MAVTIVIRTQVRGAGADFVRWQKELGQAAARAPGFVEQEVLPPDPPHQVHWITLQWFDAEADALAWLGSGRRRALLEGAPSDLLAPDDVHLLRNESPAGAGASAIIATRIRPGKEADYRDWQRRIADATTRAQGFRGYRFEPPIAGVQDDWLVVIRFESDADLRTWMDSPVRHGLLKDAESITESIRVRIVGGGLEQWFGLAGGVAPREAWKMSMVVLLVLYPTVYLLDKLVAGPLLLRQGVPPWLAMFVGNVACVTLLAFLVPWAGRRFRWWLEPEPQRKRATDLLGLAAVVGCYLLWLAIFALASDGLGPR